MEYLPRFTPIMRALGSGNPMAIRDLAAAAGISHSAASQTVARMKNARLVEQVAGSDGRERAVRLTRRGKALLPKLEVRWRATNAAAEELDHERGRERGAFTSTLLRSLRGARWATRVKDLDRRGQVRLGRITRRRRRRRRAIASGRRRPGEMALCTRAGLLRIPRSGGERHRRAAHDQHLCPRRRREDRPLVLPPARRARRADIIDEHDTRVPQTNATSGTKRVAQAKKHLVACRRAPSLPGRDDRCRRFV